MEVYNAEMITYIWIVSAYVLEKWNHKLLYWQLTYMATFQCETKDKHL